MKNKNKFFTVLMSASLTLTLLNPFSASADAVETIEGSPDVGDVIVTLGSSITKEQRFDILNKFNVVESEIPIVTVNIEDEYKYLGEFIGKEKMGTKSYSSSKIEILEEGKGVIVETDNISWVSEAMYANALITAGVKDAKVTVTAPFEVTGTGALTGVIKAYESYEGVELVEENIEVANEEMVKTAELSDEIGTDEADALLTGIKDLIASKKYTNREDLEADIKALVEDMGLTIDDATLQKLVDLYFKMSQMDIDWNQVGEQLESVKNNVIDFVGNIDIDEKKEQAEGFFAKVVEFFSNIFDSISGLFSKDNVEDGNVE